MFKRWLEKKIREYVSNYRLIITDHYGNTVMNQSLDQMIALADYHKGNYELLDKKVYLNASLLKLFLFKQF